jgi:uncharacterized protein (TIGR03066 family)
MRTQLGIGLLVVMSAATAADDKIDAKKLIGKWELAEAKETKGTLEFKKDNKFSVSFDLKGKEIKLDGTYKLDGSKLTITTKVMDMETTKSATVKKLTDEELTIEDEKGQSKTLKRAK